ncbi:MAG: cation diffusion facilitator family transporter [Bdellovibrionales bacterium]|nr:cation diffusion facilitator family transporter [Bdellovibrionales bacterium]
MLFFSVVTTGVALLPTAYASFVSNSVTLFADLLRSFVDFLAIAVAFAVTEKISRSDISTFNFGFGKLEQLASVGISLSMIVASFACLYTGIERAFHPEVLENISFGLILSALSIVGNGFLFYRFSRLSQQERSPVSSSQASLFSMKMWASAVVTLSLLVSFLDHAVAQYGDALGSIALAFFLLKSAHALAADSVGDLVDRALDEGLQLKLMQLLVQLEDEYRGFHSLRTRRSGAKIVVQVELEFAPERTVRQVLDFSEKLRSELQKLFPQDDMELSVVPVKTSSFSRES